MELHFDPDIPMHYVSKNGRKFFNKGYTPVNKGKTLEAMYGTVKANEIRKKISKRMKGRIGFRKKGINGIPVVLIIDGEFCGRFVSCHEASEKTGIHHAMISRYINNENKPRNGWKWFKEKDIEIWRKEIE